jgi:hypothetical protein
VTCRSVWRGMAAARLLRLCRPLACRDMLLESLFSNHGLLPMGTFKSWPAIHG